MCDCNCDSNMGYSTIDHLVSFGIGIPIATRMMATMNHALGNTMMPGVDMHSPQNKIGIYAYVAGDQVGPLTNEEFETLVKKGMIDDDTLVWMSGQIGWQHAKKVPHIYKLVLMNKDASL